jgi:hypothetical protein
MLERRNFLKIALGVSVVVVASVGTAQAAPYLLRRPDDDASGQAGPNSELKPEPALTTQDEVESLSPEQVQWRRRRGFGRRWGRRRWRRRYWRPRYYWRPRRRRLWRRRRVFYW